jgi:indolepyruvate ferredoxin oxidoreductase
MTSAFGLLKQFKGLRGTPLDIFGLSQDRRLERKLLADYRKDMTNVIGKLNAENLAIAIKIAELPDQIRGYGPVKEEAVEKSLLDLARLKQELAL